MSEERDRAVQILLSYIVRQVGFDAGEAMRSQAEEMVDELIAAGVVIRDDSWCNCQAIPGTQNYPGPWHPRGDQPFYPCAQKAASDA